MDCDSPDFPQAESFCKNWLTFKNASNLINSSVQEVFLGALYVEYQSEDRRVIQACSRNQALYHKSWTPLSLTSLKLCLSCNFQLNEKSTGEGEGTQCLWELQRCEYKLFYALSCDWSPPALIRAPSAGIKGCSIFPLAQSCAAAAPPCKQRSTKAD